MTLIISYCQTCDEWFERIEPLYGGSTGPGHEHSLLVVATMLTGGQMLDEARKWSWATLLGAVAV